MEAAGATPVKDVLCNKQEQATAPRGIPASGAERRMPSPGAPHFPIAFPAVSACAGPRMHLPTPCHARHALASSAEWCCSERGGHKWAGRHCLQQTVLEGPAVARGSLCFGAEAGRLTKLSASQGWCHHFLGTQCPASLAGQALLTLSQALGASGGGREQERRSYSVACAVGANPSRVDRVLAPWRAGRYGSGAGSR